MANREKQISQKLISIVIGTLNRPAVVLDLLTQLSKYSQNIPLEVLIFDQSSKKNKNILKNSFPKKDSFRLFELDKPNTCRYLNLGWKNATAPIVLYLDDDVSIDDRAIQAHLDAYTNNNTNAVAGRVINNGEKITADNRVGKVLWFGALLTKNFSHDQNTYVDFPYGCNMSFRKKIIRETGGFDEHLKPPVYAFNEVDLGYRISRRWRNSILFIPEALVYHHQAKTGGTRDNFPKPAVYYCQQFNYGYFLGKNLNLIQNLICFSRRLCYQVIKEPQAIPMIIRGYLYGKKLLV